MDPRARPKPGVEVLMKSMPNVRRPLLALAACALAPTACTVDYDLDAPPVNVQSIAEQAPLDILFVVDNSGSMLEEHETLVRTVFDDRCPITDLGDVPAPFANPPPEVLQELAKQCGIAQLLAAVGGSDDGFHIGVITTDVAECDERFGEVQDPDNLHTPTPMRGCLQRGGVRVDGERRYFNAEDDIEAGLREAMLGVGQYGSPRERGLDAMRTFLADDADRAAGCEGDLDGFLRKHAQLVVVFVVDEDDCSHDGGAYGFDDELAEENGVCGNDPAAFSELLDHPASNCYDPELRGLLAPPALYADFLKGLKTDGRTRDVFVGVVGGLVDGGEGFAAAGCRAGTEGVVDPVCTPSLGTSGGQTCAEEGANCCTADGSYRYVDVARAVNETSLLGSICAPDFRDPLLPLFFANPEDAPTL